MLEELIWVVRFVLAAGVVWGAWLCFSHTFLPARSEKMLALEHFATFALLVLVFSTLGGALHAGG
jgi:hypothetical protein